MASLAEGRKLYDDGSYSGALQSFLVALNSGVLSLPQQMNARKHIAFIHCVSNRVSLCKEEFQRAFSLSEQFDLSAAEVGHPIWGPVFRAVKAEIEQSRTGVLPQRVEEAQTLVSDKYFSEGMLAYNAANYATAITLFEEAAKNATELDKKINAQKFLAFSYCLTKRITFCRGEFGKILLRDPKFELGPAEVGHPSWGPSFKAEKAKRKQTPAGK